MTGPIQSPIKGQPMRASWGAAVSSAVNSLLPMGSDGLLASQGVTGTGFAPLPANKRDRRAAASVLPWSFSCTEDEDSGERTGGWTNCALQLGYHKIMRSPDIGGVKPNQIDGTDLTDDGEYYVEVDLRKETAEIKIATDSGSIVDDIPGSIVRIWIGTVAEGKLGAGLHYNPVVYKYV